METLRLPATPTRRGGEPALKAWLKVLTFVSPEAKDGFGYEGKFVQRSALVNETEVPEGSVLLECGGNDGSAKHPCGVYVLWQRQGEEFQQLARAEGKEWSFALRDKAIAALANCAKPQATSQTAAEHDLALIRKMLADHSVECQNWIVEQLHKTQFPQK